MPKRLAPSSRAVAAAREVLAGADVRSTWDIDVEAIAARHRAWVRYGRLDTARGCIMRTERTAIICIDERLRGTPAARFTIAHELGHHKLHTQVDHFQQCTGAERAHASFAIEREASEFSSELLLPEACVAPMCAAARPTLSDVARIARLGVSLEMAVIRYVELARAPCAAALFVRRRAPEGGGGGAYRIAWGPETASFPGRVILRREPHPESAAALLLRNGQDTTGPREVPPEAWGELTKKGELKPGTPPFIEHAVRLGEAVLSFITPAT